MPMRKTGILVWLSGLFALPLSAQVDRQYQQWMRSMFPSLLAIRNAPDNAVAVDAATKLADTFDQVAGYWSSKQSPDALALPSHQS